MARIPVGEGLGNVIAEPARAPDTRYLEGAFGTGTGRAVEQFGQRLSRQQAMEQEQALRQREAADKAKATMLVNQVETDLDVLADEVSVGIQSGQIDKTKAQEEWERRYRARIAQALPDIPAEHQEIAQMAAQGRAQRLGRAVSRAVLQRDQADTRAGLESNLEQAQRIYLQDPAAADEMAQQAIESLGPFSGLDPAQLGRLHQSWKENTRLNKATVMITDARRDNQALSKVEKALEGDEFSALDPQRKASLLGQIEGYKVANIQRAEAEMRRRQAEEERRLRIAGAQFDAAQSIITQGKVLSPDYVEQVSRAVEGTPYAAAFRETLKQAPERTAFGVQPLAVQQAALNQARAQLNAQGTNPEAEERFKALEKIYEQARRDYSEEPLQAALERGVIQSLAPVDTSSVQGLVSTFRERIDQASLTRQQTGAPVSPLLSQEAEKVGQMIAILPVDQRASAVAQIAQTIGPEQASVLGRQIAPKDKALGIAFGMAGAKTTNGRYTSELVLRGAQAMKDRSVKADNTAVTGVRARIAEEIGEAYLNQEVRDTMIEAAVLAEYGLQAEGSGDIRRSVRLVTGGIAEQGGKKVPLPYGMDQETFSRRLRELTPVDLQTAQVFVGGQELSAYKLLEQLPTLPLIHAGQGRYAVQAGGTVVARPDGRPLILEIR